MHAPPTPFAKGLQPQPTKDTRIARLWARRTALREPESMMFAVIADEPPAGVVPAGQDRLILPSRPERVDARLNRDLVNLTA